MRMQMETRTADYTPIFTTREFIRTPAHLGYEKVGAITQSKTDPNLKMIAMKVRNIGRGPAVLLEVWHQPITPKFPAGLIGVLTPTGPAEKGAIDLHELMPSEVAPIVFGPYDTRRRWLFVISCIDTIGGRHQLQIVAEVDGTSQWSMMHNRGNSWQERRREVHHQVHRRVGGNRQTIETADFLERITALRQPRRSRQAKR